MHHVYDEITFLTQTDILEYQEHWGFSRKCKTLLNLRKWQILKRSSFYANDKENKHGIISHLGTESKKVIFQLCQRSDTILVIIML